MLFPKSENLDDLKIRRALFTVSDKAGIVELAQAMASTGTEIIATGKTATVLKEAGLRVTPIEKVSGSPEAFQGRMKTLSFPVCSGILYRRGDVQDEADLAKLGFVGIDCVVVNFYPFEAAASRSGITHREMIEEVDIGGPTLVRAAAKNAPHVLVLTDSRQYRTVIKELTQSKSVSFKTSERFAADAWDRVSEYDQAIASRLGSVTKKKLRYGENPHQSGHLEFDPAGPIAWGETLTPTELSYNNILDLSSAYALASDLVHLAPDSSGVVIVKHNNPCGVAWVSKKNPRAQIVALQHAWEGDPTSAFGGVLVFTEALGQETASWLAEKFVELVSAPSLTAEGSAMKTLSAKRKNLKAVPIRRFGENAATTSVTVPGGRLVQTADAGLDDPLNSVTEKFFPTEQNALARFGIAICRALKSNAIALVREIPGAYHSFQLVGAGQGQPNRIEALKALAVPRALAALKASGGSIEDCLMISDAFFPFRDTVDAAFEAGIRTIIQPGGSIKDAESIKACNEHGMIMALTGIRHFKH